MIDDAANPQHPPAEVPPATAKVPVESLSAPAPLPSEPAQAGPSPTEIPPLPASPAPALRAAPSRALPALLALVCVLVLFGAGYLYWLSRVAAEALVAQIVTLDQRVAAVERRPIPPPVDVTPLQQRLAKLDQRMTALEEKAPAPVPLDSAARAALAELAGRVDQITARQDQLGTREQADIGKLGDLLGAQDTKLAAAAKAGGAIDALVARQTKLAALQGASTALAAGRPLGPLAGAPPALAAFADKAPPTEASLRLSYVQAAREARLAGQPAPADLPFAQRMWARLQASVTVRQGDRVLVGDPVSGILAHAQSELDAGDIAGAVGTLGQLAGPAAAAMAPWRQQAQALLDARAALLALARG